MRILYVSSHSILEHDSVKLWTDLGYDVFSVGSAYDDVPFEGKRPTILNAPRHPELQSLVHAQRVKHASESVDYPVIDWAKYDLHPDLVDWADTIIVDCFPESWIPANWGQLKMKRTIWRTIGQSNPDVEFRMAEYAAQGMQIVRYSPRERFAFEKVGAFAGEDALIRFAKDPGDWRGWTGEDAVIGNITQNMPTRGEMVGLNRWATATQGLPTRPAGPGSEAIGGVGALAYDEMREYLRRCRAYLYVGTMPASYTLGLIEAMMTGVPVIAVPWSVNAAALQWLHDLWEADAILPRGKAASNVAALNLSLLLKHADMAATWGAECRERAIELFSTAVIGPQWLAFLGNPASVAFQAERATVTA